VRDWTIPETPGGRWMSPMETSTGVVLPILSSHFRLHYTNRHHAHFYARDYKDGPEHIKAVRYSRLQLVDKAAHHSYHDHIHGTEQPQDLETAFRITLLNAAQYIPRFAVDISTGYPDVVELSRRRKRQLRNPKTFSIEKSADARVTIGKFLMDYTTSQALDVGDTRLVEEFVELVQKDDENSGLNTRKRRRLQKVGMGLMCEAMEKAVSPLERDYTEARRREFLAEGAPRTAFRALKSFVSGREPDYFQDLGGKLLTAAN
jgi:hypothetical protein